MPHLSLSAPWLPDKTTIDDLVIARGPEDVLTYEDGISLKVTRIEPTTLRDANEAVRAARKVEGPGTVALVAGAVPVSWRPLLRSEHISFLDASGVAEISWPRLSVSAGRFTTVRKRSPVSLQQGHALVVQELLLDTTGNDRPTVSEIARGCGVSLSTASRAVSQLAAQGLVTKVRVRHGIEVVVEDRNEVASVLAQRTAWPGTETAYGYVYGRTIWDAATRLSARAESARIDLAVTGRTGAAFLGVAGTSDPTLIRCWARASDSNLESIVRTLELEPVPREESNVAVSADRWRIGNHRARYGTLGGEWWATVSSPLRVWCDLRGEPRGTEFAAQLWNQAS